MTRLIMPGRVGSQMGNASCFQGTSRIEACVFIFSKWKVGHPKRSHLRGCTPAHFWFLLTDSRLRLSVPTSLVTFIQLPEGTSDRFMAWKWESNPSHGRKMGFQCSSTDQGNFRPRFRDWISALEGKLRWNN